MNIELIHSCSYHCERPECIKRQRDAMRDDELRPKYWQLIWAVGNVYEGESRHETALRYIINAENQCSGPHKAARP